MSLVCSLAASASLLPADAVAGSIRYPAPGNLELEAGTIELWLTPTVNLRPEMGESRYAAPMRLFSFEAPDEFRVDARWMASRSGTGSVYGLHVSVNARVQEDLLMSVPGGYSTDWQAGELHHVAFTWQGSTMRLYADGELLKERTQLIGFAGSLVGTDLIIGNLDGGDAGYVLHAVRVSRSALDADELADAEPVARMDTLLLDRFDLAEGDMGIQDSHTSASVIGGLLGETGGALQGTYHRVRGERAGLSLNKVEEND